MWSGRPARGTPVDQTPITQRHRGTHDVTTVFNRVPAGFRPCGCLAVECETNLWRLPHSAPEVFLSWHHSRSRCGRTEADALLFESSFVLEMAFRFSQPGESVLHRHYADRWRSELFAEGSECRAEPGGQHSDWLRDSMVRKLHSR